MRKQLFIIIYLFIYSSVSSLAQENYVTVGIGAGFSQSLADVTNKINFQRVYHAHLDYHITEFITAGAEFDLGRIRNGSAEIVPNDNPNYSRFFVNDFKAVNINAKVALAGLMNYYPGLINGIYIGTGMTAIFNNQILIRRTYTFSNGKIYDLSGKDKGTVLAFPVSAGLNVLPFEQENFSIGLDGQINVIPGDHLDGYSENIYHKRPDFLALGFISIRYNFSQKPISLRNPRF